ncbi:hypothetical protein MIO91_05710 [Agathobacter rectalis]|uniref:Uncharacterized protein n=1 Tax=Agathobacter rectalis (strain ATCC 33656 / DSM 3377 / JCM 17463 / KCTC 5835 / VPI 0990) TaxID=515619 RepID=C4Z800_AGARV|nr:hypothetical protein [Agathobacter rectalis]ACR75017.1 Hypothetical protein EUBREC_1257 [Agathobacter rectalis ATCC 33656]UML66452.1 hypothetical protein MIO91_05710 [Agathobacter rectalis]
MSFLSKLFSPKNKVNWNNYSGYLERPFVSFDICNTPKPNPYINSEIPIVKDSINILHRTEYTNTLNPDKTIHRYRKDILYYPILFETQTEYLRILEKLNTIIKQLELDCKYIIPINKICFTLDQPKSLPPSLIIFDDEKKIFDFFYRDKSNFLCVDIYFDLLGNMTKACVKNYLNEHIKENFRLYKTGFDLFKITDNDNVIYQRGKIGSHNIHDYN